MCRCRFRCRCFSCFLPDKCRCNNSNKYSVTKKCIYIKIYFYRNLKKEFRSKISRNCSSVCVSDCLCMIVHTCVLHWTYTRVCVRAWVCGCHSWALIKLNKIQFEKFLNQAKAQSAPNLIRSSYENFIKLNEIKKLIETFQFLLLHRYKSVTT